VNGSPVGAFLALWNGVRDAALVPEYEAWHAFEHVPERVGVPGFAWACRHVTGPGLQGQPAYFTLYGLDSLDALHGPRYQELLDHPSEWSARMRGVLDDFRREPCEIVSCHGHSAASRLATLQVRVASAPALADITRQLEALVQSGGAVSACLGRVDRRSTHPLSRAPAGQDGIDAVILLQHLRDGPLQAAVQVLRLSLRAPVAFYELQSLVHQRDLAHPLTARQPARPDLRQRFPTGDTCA